MGNIKSQDALVGAAGALAEAEALLAHALVEGGGLAGGIMRLAVARLELDALLAQSLLLGRSRGDDVERSPAGGT